jgi:hypothetical protein
LIINFIYDLIRLELPITFIDFKEKLSGFKKYFIEEYEKKVLYYLSKDDIKQLVYTKEKINFAVENIKIIEDKIRFVLRKFKKKFLNLEPDFVIFFGFFSPDGFVIKIKNNWYPTICLDRFFDLRNIEMIVSHELGHYILKNINFKYRPEKEEIFANYLSTIILEKDRNAVFSNGKPIETINKLYFFYYL